MANMEFLGNVIMAGEMEVKTGLHIGDEGTLQIGGVDQPVIKSPLNEYPYVPGSSIKGKLRSLLEWDQGLVEDDGDVHSHQDEGARECPVCLVFGTPADAGAETGPTRLTVRDAHPSEEMIKELGKANLDRQYTEVKTENTIDRITSEADPRRIERIPRGTKFEYELVYSVYDLDDGGQTDVDNLSKVQRAMYLLEDDALGGSGSRGYGAVEFNSDTEHEFVVCPAEGYGPDGREEQYARSTERVETILTE